MLCSHCGLHASYEMKCPMAPIYSPFRNLKHSAAKLRLLKVSLGNELPQDSKRFHYNACFCMTGWSHRLTQRKQTAILCQHRAVWLPLCMPEALLSHTMHQAKIKRLQETHAIMHTASSPQPTTAVGYLVRWKGDAPSQQREMHTVN